MKNCIYLLISLLIVACDSNEEVITNTSDYSVIGTWAYATSDTEQITFVKSAALPENKRGIQFKEDGTFIERTAGWCATPPLTFFDSQGNWERNNSKLSITLNAYPDGYDWQIVSLTENELVVERTITEKEKEHQNLMLLFNEIYELSISVTCIDASEWTFTAYGTQVCGGSPHGFIPYSTNIDVDAFLEKVKAYTEAEDAFNKKWDVVSPCAIIVAPSGVECHPNGYPVLVYDDFACGRAPVIDKALYTDLESDSFKIINAEITENCLVIEVEATACDGNSWEFKLVDSSDIAESLPEQRFLKLQLVNNEDCFAQIKRTVSFSIASLQIYNDSQSIILNLQGLDDQLHYKY